LACIGLALKNKLFTLPAPPLVAHVKLHRHPGIGVPQTV